ncbi:MAG: ribonuclease E inhibitor RraB [Gammaproteobacteria bacterium]|nr:ribonuclease E inhibitor RraB [Gammaproteobacteria bacterium]
MTAIESLIEQRVSMDKKTLLALKEAGDDEQIVRYIDHSFTSGSEHSLEKLLQSLEKMNFGGLKILPQEGDYFLLECFSIDCTEFHAVNKTSVLMTMLAEQFEVEYDGWGTSVANE